MEGQSTVNVVNMEALLSRLLNTEYIPPEVQDEWWVLCSDDISLTNFDEKQIQYMMNQFDLLELRTIRSLPGHKYDKNVVKLINAIRMVYYAKLHRAKNGFTANNLVKQISEQSVVQRQGLIESRGGLWNHIKGLVGRG